MSNGTLKNNHPASGSAKTWSTREAYLLAMVCLAVGVIAGYLLHGTPATTTPASAAPASAPAGTGNLQPLPSADALSPVLQPQLDALKVDPRNFDTLVSVGNTYFDHQFYKEAVQYYERALEVRPKDVNVRTDLGTAYFYQGSPQKALEQFQKSLAIDPAHANTLFNMGIVKQQGLHDNAGAIAAWQELLRRNPNYPNRQRVLDLIEQAKKS